MSVVIPDEIVRATGMSATELMQELAILLFQKERLSIGAACRLAGMSRFQFQHLLASRRISLHYDETDFEADIETLREMNHI